MAFISHIVSFSIYWKLKEKQKIGPDSGLQDEPLVEDQPEKLEKLRSNLTAAEAANRRGTCTCMQALCYN